MKSTIIQIKNGIFHIQISADDTFKETLLSKYGFLFEDNIKSKTDDKYSAEINKNEVSFFGGKKDLCIKFSNYCDNGFCLEIPVSDTERFFGLGDENRKTVMKRGRKAVIWQKNVTAYGPIPFLLSSEGWGILINCTYRHEFDLASDSSDKITITAKKGAIDFYVFLADSMKDIISLYTELTGKPVMLPKKAYGLTFVNNEEEGARDVLHNCFNFRREDIPCDIMGLEPGWMSKHYDYSIDKKWDPERFYLPYWQKENYNGAWSFFYNLRKMNFGLTLWLCCDYDLLWHEEGDSLKCAENSYEGANIIDDHFSGDVLMDKLTKPGEPWFEHLKKFVDQGATGFKLDGALQVMEHPDRLWAGRYTDDEVHNIYPLIYSKQMKNGYEEYTGRRSLIYTPALFAGTQHYAATWAGDTGGGEAIAGYLLNMAFCGHTNASCDMDINKIEGIHFGFLMPWAQLLSWRSWHHPWLLGDELEGIIRDYSKLRSSLFPYIYSMSHKAARTGLAITRPLSLVYEDTDKYDNKNNVYMLGDSLLVGSFNMNLTLPEGKWLDYFTGDIYEGNQQIEYIPPKGKGGALFVKEGSVFVTQKPKKCITDNVPDNYQIRVFPGNDCSFSLIDDDGETFEYLDGKIHETEISLKHTDSGFNLSIQVKCDNYKRQNENTFDIIVYMQSKPSSVLCNSEEISFEYNENILTIKTDKSMSDAEYVFKM